MIVDLKALATRAVSHANSARAMWNKNHKTWDTLDQTEVLAWVSIAESLAVIASAVAEEE
jgi:hypothetical protein